jgi:hypothetical protein
LDTITKFVAGPDARHYIALAGEPNWFLGIAVLAGISLIAALFVPLPPILKAFAWLAFVASDGAALFLVFGASPALTDDDYAPTAESPPAAVALTAEARSSDQVCVALDWFSAHEMMPVFDSYCSNGGSPRQNTYRAGVQGSRFCYTVGTEPRPGQQCRVAIHYRTIDRTRRDGLLQGLHEHLGRDAAFGPDFGPAPRPVRN